MAKEILFNCFVDPETQDPIDMTKLREGIIGTCEENDSMFLYPKSVSIEDIKEELSIFDDYVEKTEENGEEIAASLLTHYRCLKTVTETCVYKQVKLVIE